MRHAGDRLRTRLDGRVDRRRHDGFLRRRRPPPWSRSSEPRPRSSCNPRASGRAVRGPTNHAYDRDQGGRRRDRGGMLKDADASRSRENAASRRQSGSHTIELLHPKKTLTRSRRRSRSSSAAPRSVRRRKQEAIVERLTGAVRTARRGRPSADRRAWRSRGHRRRRRCCSRPDHVRLRMMDRSTGRRCSVCRCCCTTVATSIGSWGCRSRCGRHGRSNALAMWYTEKPLIISLTPW